MSDTIPIGYIVNDHTDNGISLGVPAIMRRSNICLGGAIMGATGAGKSHLINKLLSAISSVDAACLFFSPDRDLFIPNSLKWAIGSNATCDNNFTLDFNQLFETKQLPRLIRNLSQQQKSVLFKAADLAITNQHKVKSFQSAASFIEYQRAILGKGTTHGVISRLVGSLEAADLTYSGVFSDAPTPFDAFSQGKIHHFDISELASAGDHVYGRLMDLFFTLYNTFLLSHVPAHPTAIMIDEAHEALIPAGVNSKTTVFPPAILRAYKQWRKKNTGTFLLTQSALTFPPEVFQSGHLFIGAQTPSETAYIKKHTDISVSTNLPKASWVYRQMPEQSVEALSTKERFLPVQTIRS